MGRGSLVRARDASHAESRLDLYVDPCTRPILLVAITEEDGKLQDKLNDLKMPATFVPGQVIVSTCVMHIVSVVSDN